jgi:hypothetical protein
MNTERWRVLIEENHNGERWDLSRVEQATDRENAVALAEEAAYHYLPANPRKEERRSVFRCLDGSWLVDVTGVSGRRFHFRVTVAEWVADVPAGNRPRSSTRGG